MVRTYYNIFRVCLGSDSCDSESDSDRDSDSGLLRFYLWICFMIAQNYKACEYIILRSVVFSQYVCGGDSDSYSISDSDGDRKSDSDSDRDNDSVSSCFHLQIAFIMVELVSSLRYHGE